MLRRSFGRGELLLAVLRLLEPRPMSDGEVVAELEARAGGEYRVKRGEVLVALEALAVEGLVEVAHVRGFAVYQVTPEGTDALRRRADAPVLARADRPTPSGDGSEGADAHEVERVAILFTDVVRSTELIDRLGEQAAHALRRRHFALMRGAVREHDGHEVKTLGDGLMVAFDEERAGVECALAMQRAVAACEDPLELRIGIAAGEVVREDGDYFGRPVIVARRLCDAARGGEVLVSEPPAGLTAGSTAHELVPRGPLTLKGLSEPVAASAIRMLPLTLSA